MEPINIDAQALFDVLSELYPRELKHALAEVRARRAEARLAELEVSGEIVEPDEPETEAES